MNSRNYGIIRKTLASIVIAALIVVAPGLECWRAAAETFTGGPGAIGNIAGGPARGISGIPGGAAFGAVSQDWINALQGPLKKMPADMSPQTLQELFKYDAANASLAPDIIRTLASMDLSDRRNWDAVSPLVQALRHHWIERSDGKRIMVDALRGLDSFAKMGLTQNAQGMILEALPQAINIVNKRADFLIRASQTRDMAVLEKVVSQMERIQSAQSIYLAPTHRDANNPKSMTAAYTQAHARLSESQSSAAKDFIDQNKKALGLSKEDDGSVKMPGADSAAKNAAAALHADAFLNQAFAESGIQFPAGTSPYKKLQTLFEKARGNVPSREDLMGWKMGRRFLENGWMSRTLLIGMERDFDRGPLFGKVLKIISRADYPDPEHLTSDQIKDIAETTPDLMKLSSDPDFKETGVAFTRQDQYFNPSKNSTTDYEIDYEIRKSGSYLIEKMVEKAKEYTPDGAVHEAQWINYGYYFKDVTPGKEDSAAVKAVPAPKVEAQENVPSGSAQLSPVAVPAPSRSAKVLDSLSKAVEWYAQYGMFVVAGTTMLFGKIFPLLPQIAVHSWLSAVGTYYFMGLKGSDAPLSADIFFGAMGGVAYSVVAAFGIAPLLGLSPAIVPALLAGVALGAGAAVLLRRFKIRGKNTPGKPTLGGGMKSLAVAALGAAALASAPRTALAAASAAASIASTDLALVAMTAGLGAVVGAALGFIAAALYVRAKSSRYFWSRYSWGHGPGPLEFHNGRDILPFRKALRFYGVRFAAAGAIIGALIGALPWFIHPGFTTSAALVGLAPLGLLYRQTAGIGGVTESVGRAAEPSLDSLKGIWEGARPSERYPNQVVRYRLALYEDLSWEYAKFEEYSAPQKGHGAEIVDENGTKILVLTRDRNGYPDVKLAIRGNQLETIEERFTFEPIGGPRPLGSIDDLRNTAWTLDGGRTKLEVYSNLYWKRQLHPDEKDPITWKGNKIEMIDYHGRQVVGFIQEKGIFHKERTVSFMATIEAGVMKTFNNIPPLFSKEGEWAPRVLLDDLPNWETSRISEGGRDLWRVTHTPVGPNRWGEGGSGYYSKEQAAAVLAEWVRKFKEAGIDVVGSRLVDGTHPEIDYAVGTDWALHTNHAGPFRDFKSPLEAQKDMERQVEIMEKNGLKVFYATVVDRAPLTLFDHFIYYVVHGDSRDSNTYQVQHYWAPAVHGTPEDAMRRALLDKKAFERAGLTVLDTAAEHSSNDSSEYGLVYIGKADVVKTNNYTRPQYKTPEERNLAMRDEVRKLKRAGAVIIEIRLYAYNDPIPDGPMRYSYWLRYIPNQQDSGQRATSTASPAVLDGYARRAPQDSAASRSGSENGGKLKTLGVAALALGVAAAVFAPRAALAAASAVAVPAAFPMYLAVGAITMALTVFLRLLREGTRAALRGAVGASVGSAIYGVMLNAAPNFFMPLFIVAATAGLFSGGATAIAGALNLNPRVSSLIGAIAGAFGVATMMTGLGSAGLVMAAISATFVSRAYAGHSNGINVIFDILMNSVGGMLMGFSLPVWLGMWAGSKSAETSSSKN